MWRRFAVCLPWKTMPKTDSELSHRVRLFRYNLDNLLVYTNYSINARAIEVTTPSPLQSLSRICLSTIIRAILLGLLFSCGRLSLGRWRFTVRSYCGPVERQVSLRLRSDGLTAAFHTFLFKNMGIPSAPSDCTLALSPLMSSVLDLHEKRPTLPKKLNRASTKGIKINTQTFTNISEQ